MIKKATVIIAVMLVATVAAFYAVDAAQPEGCSSKQATAKAAKVKAETAGKSCSSSRVSAAVAGTKSSCSQSASVAVTDRASCEEACKDMAAKVTANKPECCQKAVAAVMASWSKEVCSTSAAATKTAGTKSSCSTSAAATKTAGTKSSCSTSAAATKTAGTKSSCSTSAAKLASAVSADMGDCCKATVNAFVSAVAEYETAQRAKSADYALAGSGSCSKATAKTAGSGDCCEKGMAKTAGSSCSKSKTRSASLSDIAYREGKRMVLTGHAVCAKCNMGVSEACASVFQTADGKYYRLLKNNHVKKMRSAKAEHGYEIVSYVRKLDGVKYLDVQSTKTL